MTDRSPTKLSEDEPAATDRATDAVIRGLEILNFDPDAILLRDPSMLLDRHFLGALHAEMIDELGDADAHLTLFQMGFLHGLQDAFLALQDAFEERAWTDPCGMSPLLAPPLVIQMRPELGGDGSAEQRASITLSGTWPERNEASAYLAALGAPESPICFLSAGYTSGWLSGTLEADIVAIESDCCATGSANCEFTARESAAWCASGESFAKDVVDVLPFDAMRAFVRQNGQADSDARRDEQAHDDRFIRSASGSGSEAREPIVHIWGPVMVIPFTNGDEALKAVDLLGRDPAARNVSVVIVDLSAAVIDEAYGAVALEQTLDMIEAWGAEAILASPTPMSEPAVADLERQPMFIMKDMAQAVAAAFQIADAQRRPS